MAVLAQSCLFRLDSGWPLFSWNRAFLARAACGIAVLLDADAIIIPLSNIEVPKP